MKKHTIWPSSPRSDSVRQQQKTTTSGDHISEDCRVKVRFKEIDWKEPLGINGSDTWRFKLNVCVWRMPENYAPLDFFRVWSIQKKGVEPYFSWSYLWALRFSKIGKTTMASHLTVLRRLAKVWFKQIDWIYKLRQPLVACTVQVNSKKSCLLDLTAWRLILRSLPKLSSN